VFYNELHGLLKDRGISLDVEPLPKQFHLILLAPPKFWKRLLNTKEITKEKWEHFRTLSKALTDRGYPVSLLQVDDNMQISTAPDFCQ
jgi:hypothetical protein